MTVVNPKSISGINSITTGSGSDNLLTIHTSDASNTERFRIDSTGTTKIVTGIVTTLTATTGIVTTLTTNTLTANSTTKVGSGITVSPDGDIFATGVTTATTFSGSGASLTNLNASNLASGTVPTARLGSGTASSSTFLRGDSTFAAVTSTTINNNANNRVITGSGSANTLEGEQRLTYDGNGIFNITGTGAAGVFVITPDTVDGGIYFNDGSSNKGALTYLHSNETMNFRVNGTNKMTIKSTGHMDIEDGNLEFAAGHGIDFSNNSNASGVSSNLFDDYEEGSFTPTVFYGSGSFSAVNNVVCRYVKVGSLVHVSGRFSLTGGGSGELKVEGLPFAKGNPSGDGNSAGIQIYVEGAASNIANGIVGLVLDATTQIYIRRNGATGSGNDMAGLVDGGTTLLIGGTYNTVA